MVMNLENSSIQCLNVCTYQMHEYCMVSDGANALQLRAFQRLFVSVPQQKCRWVQVNTERYLNNWKCCWESGADSYNGAGPWGQKKLQNNNVNYVKIMQRSISLCSTRLLFSDKKENLSASFSFCWTEKPPHGRHWKVSDQLNQQGYKKHRCLQDGK